MKKIVIIDYLINNLWSVQSALNNLGYNYKISNDSEVIKDSSHLILPGVGSFRLAMLNIKKLRIDQAIKSSLNNGSKILGICLGMQLLASRGYEDGNTAGLNLINAEVKKINISKNKKKIKIPHVGFNSVKFNEKSNLFKGINNYCDFYFVHSFVLSINKLTNDHLISTCNYGEAFISSVEYKNIYGTQFHPEKSQKNGLKIIKNFINL